MRGPGGQATGAADRSGPTDLEWGMARGLALYRVLAWAWAVVVTVVTRTDLSKPGVAIALLAVTGAFSALTVVASTARRHALFSPVTVAIEVLLAVGLLVADGWIYDERHGQTFGSAWPVAAALSVGIRFGVVGGSMAGLLLGVGRAAGSAIASFGQASALSLASSTVLFTMAGGASGALMERIRRAETTMARARAREEVARTLHDGVLQTLAVIQRRSPDTELAALAREQELDLRAYLAGDGAVETDLLVALRRAAAHVERRDGLRCEVVVVDDDLPPIDPRVIAAVAGAAREALTNAAKHAGATRATVLLDVGDDDVFCSVKDDGVGFDPTTTVPGRGIGESIRGRMAEVGGTAVVDGRPGTGVEVRLTAPLRVARP